MRRSERLAKSGLIEVFCIGGLCEAKITERETISFLSRKGVKMRYVGTDFECAYNGGIATADIYEDKDGYLFAVID